MPGPQGPFSLPSLSAPIVSVATNYTVALGVDTVLCDATAGNMTIYIPAAAKNPNRYIKVIKTDSSANSVTITLTSGDTALTEKTLVLYNQYGTVQLGSNGRNGWALLYSSRFTASAQTSSTCGTFSTTSTGFTDITNLSIALVTTSGFVELKVVPDGTSNFLEWQATTNGAVMRCTRDGTDLGSYFIGAGTPAGFALVWIDTGATSGSHTYKIQTKIQTSGTSLLQNAVLTGKEPS